MSDENDKDKWARTGDPLRYHLEQMDLRHQQRFEGQQDAIEAAFKAQDDLLSMHMKLLDERYATQTKAVEAALEAQQTAMRTAFVASQQAVDKALAAAEKAVEQRAAHLDREFHEHLEQVRHENALAFLNSDKAVQSAFTASDKAITKAENAAEKRFEAVNGFRDQLADQAATLLSRSEADVRINALNEKVDSLKSRIDEGTGRSAGVGMSASALVGTLTAVVAVVTIVIVLANVMTGGG